MNTRNEIVLEGCAPVPLMAYLKALGIFRLVAEQRDSSCRAFWREDEFVIETVLTREKLEAFVLRDYQPSAILAPWNGGSGFYPSDNSTAFEPILASEADRLRPLSSTLAAAQAVVQSLGLEEKPDTETKAQLLELCRARFPDHALAWMDAAVVLTDDSPRYPPLLGTGGNDGRLEFTNNYFQRLVAVIDPTTGEPTSSSQAWLRTALSGELCDGLGKDVMGQFEPAAQRSNPWDYILMLEGAVFFAASTASRLNGGSVGQAAPFTVRQTAAGYGSVAENDEANSRGELWLPLWGAPTTVASIRALFSEGRANVGRREAVDGLDFALAVASLGVDRGIDRFARYGFQVRNGLSYYATPLGTFSAGRRDDVTDLVGPIDRWLQSFRRAARQKNTPARVVAAGRSLDEALLALAQRDAPADLLRVFTALGAVERALAGSIAWTREKRVSPLPALAPEWAIRAYDGTVEFRVAAALAASATTWTRKSGRVATPIRARLEPVETRGRTLRWLDNASRDVVPMSGSLIKTLHDIGRRNVVDYSGPAGAANDHWNDRAIYKAPRAAMVDVAAFVDGDVQDARIYDLMWAMAAIDWPSYSGGLTLDPRDRFFPTAAYGMLKLCFAGAKVADVAVPVTGEILRLAEAGNPRAFDVAQRRLRGSGLVPKLAAPRLTGTHLNRLAAALMIPLREKDLRALTRQLLDPQASLKPFLKYETTGEQP